MWPPSMRNQDLENPNWDPPIKNRHGNIQSWNRRKTTCFMVQSATNLGTLNQVEFIYSFHKSPANWGYPPFSRQSHLQILNIRYPQIHRLIIGRTEYKLLQWNLWTRNISWKHESSGSKSTMFWCKDMTNAPNSGKESTNRSCAKTRHGCSFGRALIDGIEAGKDAGANFWIIHHGTYPTLGKPSPGDLWSYIPFKRLNTHTETHFLWACSWLMAIDGLYMPILWILRGVQLPTKFI